MRPSIRWAASLLAAVSVSLSGCASDDPLHDAVPEGTGGTLHPKPPDPCAEGDQRACKIDLPTQGDVIHCMHGMESCVGGAWGACVVSAGEIGALPAVEPCSQGARRKCYFQLPAQGALTNCYYGWESCSEGAWGPCVDGALESSGGTASAAGDDAQDDEGPAKDPLSLSEHAPCLNDPCNPTCQRYDEIPLAGVSLPGKAIPPWDSGSFSSVSTLPGFAAKAMRQPCGSASDCQVNQLCALPLTSGSVHDKCAPGVALADTGGADACVDAICARRPTCCAAASGTCAHDRCTTGAPLAAGCDLCVSAVCALHPSCCSAGGAWDAACVEQVAKVCNQSCNQWDASCVAEVHDTCGAFCTALPATAPPAQCEHDKCYTGGKISAACADPCVAGICAHPTYAYCCTTAWDNACLNAVNSVCGETCPLKGQCTSWLGGQTDPFCPDRPDLTLGVPCNSKIPVCNVGGAPAHAPIEVLSAPASTLTMPGCAPSASALACPALMEDIAPGQCVNLDCPGLASGAGEELMVNAGGSVSECVSTPGKASCNAANSNNWSLSGGPTTCEPPICTGSQQPSQIKAPNFHFLVERSLASASPPVKWSGIVNGIGNFLSSAGAAGAKAAVQFFPDGPPSLPAACDAVACAVGSSPAAPYGNTASCAVRTLPNLGLQNLPNAAFAASVKAVSVGAGLAPTPMAYAGAVNLAKGYGGDRDIVLVMTSDVTTCNVQLFTSVSSLAGQASNAFVNSKIKTWVITVGLISALYDPIARAGGTGAAIAVPTGDDVALTNVLAALKLNYYACSYPLPPAALFDKSNPKVELKSATGAVVSTFVQVATAASCGPASTGHFYYDDNVDPTKLILCPATCAAVRPNIGFAVKLTLSCPGTYTDWEHSEIYSGVCPLGSRVSWGFLTFDTSEPPSTSTTFLVHTAPELVDLPTAPLRKLITAEPGVPDTQKCTMAGPAPCPIDLFTALGGPPAARHEQLELLLDMHTNVSHSRSPTINSWQITYACMPDE
jgi:hypothetical protein